MTLAIGKISLPHAAVLAPMSGVTDMPFRRAVRRAGGGLVVTEMIASAAILRQVKSEMRKLRPHGTAAWALAPSSTFAYNIDCYSRAIRRAQPPEVLFAPVEAERAHQRAADTPGLVILRLAAFRLLLRLRRARFCVVPVPNRVFVRVFFATPFVVPAKRPSEG